MNAEELYLHIKSLHAVNDLIICDLHNPCKIARKCQIVHHWPIIDFDDIKTKFHQGLSGDTPASVDGITFSGRRFCFVEIKGWVEFLNHLKARNQELAIARKAASYDLSKKLFDSISICQILSGIEDLLSSLPVTYVLVTDIETESNGLAMFHNNLLRLADPTDNWFAICNRELKARLTTIPGNIPTVYVSCKDFDQKMAMLA